MVYLPCVSAQVILNEMMASNEGVMADEDGDFEDWVELYNASSSAINLDGYSITDDEDDLNQWSFPSYFLQPGEFLVVFCSGKDRISGPFFHTNFKINKDGETLVLTHPSGQEEDRINAISLATNWSFGHLIDGTSYRERFDEPTPGASNETVNTVYFSHQSGYYADAIQVELYNPQGHPIRYTLDGSEPNQNSWLYTEPIVMSSLQGVEPTISMINTSINWIEPPSEVDLINVIRAKVIDNGVDLSPCYGKSYLIGEPFDEIFANYPVVSIQTTASNFFDDETGIYVPGVNFNGNNPEWTGNFFQRGSEWERDMHIEFLENGTHVWAQEAAVRIHGGKTRNAPQKSLRLYARSIYGAGKFQHKIFETKDKTTFDKLIMRAHFGCWNKTMIKDGVSAYIAQDLDFDTQHSRPAIVFLNGEFWGVQTFRERYDDNYFEEEYAIPKEEINILLHGSGTNPNHGSDWGIEHGDNAHYLAMLDYIDNNDLSVQEHYEFVKTKMDVNSMIEFFCTAIYFNQYDWPSNNHKVWRGPDNSKWRWMMYDFDSAWGYRPVNFDLLAYAAHPTGSSIYNTPYTTFLFRNLLEAEEFREHFMAKMACLMNTAFEPSVVESALDHFVELYLPIFERHRGRWNNVANQSSWLNIIDDKLYDFNEGRREHAIAFISTFFDVDFDPDTYDCETIIEEEEEVEKEEVSVAEGKLSASSLVVYPNPAQEIAWVDYEGASSSAILRVYDLNGRMVYSNQYRFHSALPLSEFQGGLYLLVLEDEGTRLTSKLLVK